MRQNDNKLVVFEGRQIRKVLHEGEWWFSIVDVVQALVGGDRPRKYWNDLKKKLFEEGYDQSSEKIGQLKMPSTDGKLYETDCANTETLFRIIQSILSPKVEPLKRWLARVAKERIDEIKIPEDYGDDVDIAPGPDGILALAVASLADIPASDRDLLTRKLGERER